ncbi:MAG: sensor histidine kinase [bacterium]
MAQAAEPEYKIGVLAFRGHAAAIHQWSETANYLSAEIDGASFRVVPLDLTEMSDAVASDELDFVLTNTGHYVDLEARHGISRLSTIRNLRQGTIITEFGAVIFTRSDHPVIAELEDSAGHSFVAVSANAFGGFQMAWRELIDVGVDPFSDFESLNFSGFPQDNIVYAVLQNKFDIGTVRSDVLERMALEGKIDIDNVRILNQQSNQSYPFLHSTRLYPEWPFSKARHTPQDLAQSVTVALLKLNSESTAARSASIAGWTIPLDYGSVHELFRELEIGPYKRSEKPRLEEVWAEFKEWILFSIFALFILVTTTILVSRANRRLASSQIALQKEVEQRTNAQMELATHRDNLETQVAKRTAELAKANQSLTRSEHTLRKLHDITASVESGLDVKFHRLLALGCRLFKSDIGFLINSSTELTDTTNFYVEPDNENAILSKRQIEKFAAIFIAEQANKDAAYWTLNLTALPTDHPLQKSFQSGGSFVAAYVYGLKDAIGVIGFYSARAGVAPVSEVEKDILLLIAQWIGREIERNAAADKLQQRQAQMAKASRLNTLGEMAAGIAHELNQPLTAISNYGHGCIRRMEKSTGIDKDLSAAILQMAHEAGRAGEIMDRLREIVQPGEINRGLISAQDCIETAIAIIQPSLDHVRINIHVEGPDLLPSVLADQIQIEQVALNLIRNAIDALVDSTVPEKRIDIRLSCINTDWVRVSIHNTGPPIPESAKKELFNPFISSKEEGMGLGLAISRSIIESHGGEIGLEDCQSGPLFYFTLPCEHIPPSGDVSSNYSTVNSEHADERS